MSRSTPTTQTTQTTRRPARNAENDKKTRILRNLRGGKRSSVPRSILEELPWTEEQRAELLPYLQDRADPFDVSDTTVSPTRFTKKEAYDAIQLKTQNETTRKNYRSRVNALLALMEVDGRDFSRIFENPTRLLGRIAEHYRDPTSYYDFLYYILKASPKLLNDHQPDKGLVPPSTLEMIEKTRNESKNKQVAKQLQDRRNDVEYVRVWKQIFDTERRLSESDYGSMKHVIALMYTKALYDRHDTIHMNPRNYFLKVLLVRDDAEINDKDNFYNPSSGRLVINDYKTAKIYDPYDVVLTPYCVDVIAASLRKHPRKYLVEQVRTCNQTDGAGENECRGGGGGSGERGNPANRDHGLYKNNSLSDMVKAVFGGFSINKIRKSIESYEINVKKTSCVHLADVSRHTVMTQTTNYLAT